MNVTTPPRRIAIVSGTGKTGRAIAAAVRATGNEPVALGRTELADPIAALSDCQAAYLMAPNLHSDELGFIEMLLDACRSAGVKRIVYHSVAAPYAPSMPHHLAKAESEDKVRRSKLPFTIVQPCAYVDNLLPGLRESEPVISVAYDPDAPFGFIGLADVGEAAARLLTTEDHLGASLELGGPQLVSVREVAQAAERVLGAEVALKVTAPDDWAVTQELRGSGAGLDAREREWLKAMFDYYDRYGLPCGSAGIPAILSRAALGVEEVLADELSDIYTGNLGEDSSSNRVHRPGGL